MIDELAKQLQMTYDQQCQYLQKKYGLPPRDFFANETCRSKVKANSRTSEGLVLHHNAEGLNNSGNLGESHLAKLNPWEYQKRENLSYCNYLEHLILHLKINARGCSTFEWPFEIHYFFNSLGFFWIGNAINSWYRNDGSNIEWMNHCYSVIRDYFEDYVTILKGTLCFLEDNYVGVKTLYIEEGTELCFDQLKLKKDTHQLAVKSHYNRYKCRIITVNETDDTVLIKCEDGSHFHHNLTKLKNQYDFTFHKKTYTLIMCSLTPEEAWPELLEKVSAPYTAEDRLVAKWLKNFAK